VIDVSKLIQGEELVVAPTEPDLFRPKAFPVAGTKVTVLSVADRWVRVRTELGKPFFAHRIELAYN
jgi:hypothetical protein